MFYKLIFAFLVVFLTATPLHASNEPGWINPDEPLTPIEPDKKLQQLDMNDIKNLIVVMESALQCQVAVALTQNYYSIYLGFKRGIEKTDLSTLETPKSVKALKPIFVNYEQLIVRIKTQLKKEAPSIDLNEIEKKRFKDIKSGFTYRLLNEFIKPNYVSTIMELNKECYSKFKNREKLVNRILKVP